MISRIEFLKLVYANNKRISNSIIEEQETVVDAALSGDYEKAFVAFLNNPNMCLSEEKARELFDKMLENTKAYLPYYDAYVASRAGK